MIASWQNLGFPGSTIARLPPEILGRIFLCLTTEDQPREPLRTPADPSSYRLGWANVTHVCRYWREVALNYPALWSDFEAHTLSLKWNLEFQLRASPLPLSIFVDLNKPLGSSEANIETVMGTVVILRLSRLALVLPPDTAPASLVLANFFSRLRRDAPFLQSLEVAYPMKYPYIIPRPLVNLNLNLASLTLRNCYPPWRSLILPQLSSLDVETPYLDADDLTGEHVGTRQAVVAALRSMPRLATLRLYNAIPTNDNWRAGRAWGDEGTVALPLLMDLSLIGHTPSYIDFILQLVFPPSARVYMHLCGDVASHCLPLLLQRVASPRRMPTMVLDCRFYTDLHLELWDEIDRIDESVEPSFSVHIGKSSRNGDENGVNYISGNPCLGLHLGDLVSLTFETSFPGSWTAQRVREAIGPAFKLQALRLKGIPSITACISAMMDTTPTVMFPELKRLDLADVDLEYAWMGGRLLRDELAQFLEMRQMRGLQLHELCIPDRSYSANARICVDRLGRAVSHLYFTRLVV